MAGKDSVSIGFDDGISAGLRKFANDLREKALRPAAHAAAVVLYNELQQRVPEESGRLKSAIYRWHDDKRSIDGRQVYVVGVNKRKAPHWHLIEYGHWRVNRFRLIDGKWVATKERLPQPVWVPAQPYIRPTYDGKIDTAVDAAKARLTEKFKEITHD